MKRIELINCGIDNQALDSMNFETGKNVKVIFRNALHHYNMMLEKLKNEKELDFSNPRIQEAIQENIDKNTKMIKKLGSNEWFITLDENRKFLCDCLRGYISYLEIAKNIIETKLQETLSLPVIDLTKVDDELELSKRILKKSCEDHDT
ncbi:MAG TPA: hypothetical protein VHH33_03545 [Nitrososphaeraceae archaeon]|nr:hypothetical protein [Nitrososphaeraceae archaeon]